MYRPVPSRPWSCWTCGSTFSTGFRLMRHKEHVHEQPRRAYTGPLPPETCGDCSMRFWTRDEVGRHWLARHPRRALTDVV